MFGLFGWQQNVHSCLKNDFSTFKRWNLLQSQSSKLLIFEDWMKFSLKNAYPDSSKIWIMQQWIIKKGSWILFTYQSHGFDGILTFLGYDYSSRILSSENTKDSKVMKLTWKKEHILTSGATFSCFQRFSFIYALHFVIIFLFTLKEFQYYLVVYAGLFITVLVSTLLKNQ